MNKIDKHELLYDLATELKHSVLGLQDAVEIDSKVVDQVADKIEGNVERLTKENKELRALNRRIRRNNACRLMLYLAPFFMVLLISQIVRIS